MTTSKGKMYADIRDFNALCAGDLGSDRTTLKLEAETKSLTYKMNGIPFLTNANISANMDVDADLANNKYTLKDNTIRLNAIQAGIDGWVELKDPAIDMDLKLNTNDVGFKEILSLIPAILRNGILQSENRRNRYSCRISQRYAARRYCPRIQHRYASQERYVPLSGIARRSRSDQH